MKLIIAYIQPEALNDVNGIAQDLPGAPAGPEHDLNGDGHLDLVIGNEAGQPNFQGQTGQGDQGHLAAVR